MNPSADDDDEAELSPSQRFAAAKRRNIDAKGELAAFREQLPFGLDEFQIEGCRALDAGRSVLVAAPTGSGKTIVGEFAIHLALAQGTRAFYTTPIKALSNQKYHDLVERYGSEKVGLLTGDTVINGDADVVVMTTEVLRNMLYDSSRAIDNLSHVVMDEVHYLADRQRGSVWEEVILHLPQRVGMAALSATVSNAEEFGAWLQSVRGDTAIVVEDQRPTPLHQHVFTGRELVDLFGDDGKSVNPVLERLAQDDARRARTGRNGERHGARRGGNRRPGGMGFIPRARTLERLQAANLLPALVFVFSRRGCSEAVVQCLQAGVRLTDEKQRQYIRSFVGQRCASVPDADLSVLGFYEFRDGLERGIAAHHAGMLPLFKEIVEELFVQGMTKAVFATETLALGINMPARSVVLERLVKWNGTTHADITAGEYTQLTGRAGRRGIDTEGHAVTVWHNGMDPAGLAGLASTRTYPLKSSFAPSYNMAVNLVERMGVAPARELLEMSFAQFQADEGVVGLAQQIRRHEDALAGYAESMTCHLGDFAEYAALRQELADRERSLSRQGAARRRASAEQSLAALKVGDVIALAVGRHTGPGLVVEPAREGHPDPRPAVLTPDRRVKRISAVDTPHGVEVVDRLKVPKNFDSRSANWRRDLARTLVEHTTHSQFKRPRRGGDSQASNDQQIADLRAALRVHPCHGCNDREAHARWANRYHKLNVQTDQLRQRMKSRTNSVARQFDRVCALLTEFGYLEGTGDSKTVTPTGEMLARLYSDQDLLAAECLRRDVWRGLTAPELAGACSGLIFESRVPEDAQVAPALPPSQVLRYALEEQELIAEELAERESKNKLAFVRAPHPGFSNAAWAWADGDPLHLVLTENDLAPGDFVRWCRQLIDLLGQIAGAATDKALGDTAAGAARALRRGVVAHQVEV